MPRCKRIANIRRRISFEINGRKVSPHNLENTLESALLQPVQELITKSVGSANQKSWTQKIYKHTNKFQNPMHQNYKPVKAIEILVYIPASAIHSLVVFFGDSTFNTAMTEYVPYASGYIRYIKSEREREFEPDYGND